MSNTNAGKREKLRLTFPDKQKFKGTIKQEFMTTNKLSRIFNNIFRNIFKDYNGCVIQPADPRVNPNQTVLLQLDFIPGMNNGAGGIAAFGLVGDNGKVTNYGNNGSRVATMLEMNNRLNNQGLATYTITQDAADILSEYTIMSRPGIEVTRNIMASRCAEWVDANQYQRTIHQSIDCMDINKLISGMMEQAEEKGDRYFYQVFPIRPYYIKNPDGTIDQSRQPSANYLYSVMQLSKKDVDEMAIELGIYDSISTNNVNTIHD